MTAFRGSCLCGEVAFEVEGPFDLFVNGSPSDMPLNPLPPASTATAPADPSSITRSRPASCISD
jgi:hypothetical protein